MLFLTLASGMMKTVSKILEETDRHFQVCWDDSSCFASLYLTILKEKQSEKVSTNYKSEESSLFRLLKASRTWLRW